MADKPITDLVAASQITETDLFVLEQAGTAKKLTGRVLFNWLMSMVDGHGGIRNIEKTGTEGLTDTYRITFSDGSTFSYNIANGRSIREISLLGRNGLVDDYAIRFNDGSDYRFSVTNGAKGDPGEKTYLWIKYASQMPTEESHSFGDEPDRYIGVYWGDLPTAPTEWHLYKWSKIQGDQGEPGNQGNPGVTPRLSIGVVTTVDANQQASASIVGSAENPILNLSLPRGRPGADGSGSSDWNVNAPGANGYVYNRTHYVEDEEVLAFDGNYEFSGNSVSIPVSLSTEKIGAEKNYRVVFSGLSYDLIMRDVSPVFSQKTFAFGNLRLIHNSFEDTGEPFCIKYIFPTETIEIVSPDSSGRSVPVAVYYGEKIAKLDNKFIDADWMAKKTIVGVTGVILDTTTVSFASSTIIDGFAEIAIEAGGEYIVTWNNVDYTVTAYETDGFTCLGNSVLGGGHVETDEPFYIASLGGPRCMVFKTPEVQQTITMKIVGNGKTVYSKLPNEYLPDDIISDELISKSVEDYLEKNPVNARSDWNAAEGQPGHILNRTHWAEENGILEVLPECQPEFVPDDAMFFVMGEVPIAVGGEYTVRWNGVDYNCTAQSVDIEGLVVPGLGNLAAVGLGEETTDPFVIVATPVELTGGSGAQAIPLDGTTELTISITTVGEVIHKLDEKFLPMDTLRDVVVFEFDDYPHHTEQVPQYSQIEKALLSGKDVILSFRNGEEWYRSCGIGPADLYFARAYAGSIESLGISRSTGLVTYNTKPIPDDYYINRLIDAKSIPIPATAKVGQTIKVSAVDENGKPTAWEAVDFPSGYEWEKIGDVTLTEEVSQVDFNTTLDGQAFEATEVHAVIMYYTNAEGKGGDKMFVLNGKTTWLATTGNNSTTGANYLRMAYNAETTCMWYTPHSTGTGQNSVNVRIKPGDVTATELITKVGIRTGNTFGVNSRIAVWAKLKRVEG